MKKKLLTVVSVVVLILSLSVFAEEGTFHLETIGEYRKFATQKQLIPPPRGPVVTVYHNIGIMDKDGNVVVQPVFREIHDFKDNRSLFVTQEGMCGFFDENWNVVIEPVYRSAASFSEGLALVTDESFAYGFIDKDGNTVIPFTLDYAESFQNGAAVVGKVDHGYNHNVFIRTGKMDRECRMIEPIRYNWLSNYGEEYDVQMSANNININGTTYKNSDLAYPYINYLGYTYIPLCFYNCFELGFVSTWSREQGLVLHKTGVDKNVFGNGIIFQNVLGENDMVPGKMFKAKLYRGSVTIGGETYSADDVYYPLLTYRDVVYIPVLWRQAMEGLGLNYSYDLETTSLVFETAE